MIAYWFLASLSLGPQIKLLTFASSDQQSLIVSAIFDRALLLLPGCLFALLARPGCEFDICTARINEAAAKQKLESELPTKAEQKLESEPPSNFIAAPDVYIEASADEHVNAPGMHAWIDKGIITS